MSRSSSAREPLIHHSDGGGIGETLTRGISPSLAPTAPALGAPSGLSAPSGASSHERPESKRTLGVFSLLVIAFFWVSGGIFGNEAVLKAAPAAYVFAGLLLAPLIYAIPISLITAELATSMPRDGGMVAWTHAACGHILGAHNAYWLWAAYIFDSAVYPVLAGEYAIAIFDLDGLSHDATMAKSLFAMIIIIVITILKLMGTGVLVKVSTFLLLLSLVPSIIYVFYGFKVMKPKEWINTDYIPGQEINWSLFFSWILWLYCGFFSLGSLAGEVSGPKSTFLVVIAILVPFVVLVNVLPLAVSVSLDSDLSHYDAGYFTQLSEMLAGKWLGYMFVIGANVCQVGIYLSKMMTCERSMLFFFEEHFQEDMRRIRLSRSKFVEYLFHENGTGVAPVYILANACFALVLCWLPYGLLVEFSMTVLALSMMLFLYSFITLRVKEPDLKRPYKVPGNIVTAILFALLPFVTTFTNFYFSITDNAKDETLGIPYAKLLAVNSVIILGVIVHLVWVFRRKLCWCRSPPPRIPEDIVTEYSVLVSLAKGDSHHS